MASSSAASTRALSDHGVRAKAGDAGPVLSFHAACLWRQDVTTLLPGAWLNDNIIVWWEEAMTHEEYAGRRELCLLHPGAVFLCNFETVDECAGAAPRTRACARCSAATRPPTAHARARAPSPLSLPSAGSRTCSSR